jgi:hypothetical protein
MQVLILRVADGRNYQGYVIVVSRVKENAG